MKTEAEHVVEAWVVGGLALNRLCVGFCLNRLMN
jgi:hypothetical protein